jgi:hypothetical protein
VNDAVFVVLAASAGAAVDNGLPDPARDATPAGTPGCKNAGSIVWDSPRT